MEIQLAFIKNLVTKLKDCMVDLGIFRLVQKPLQFYCFVVSSSEDEATNVMP